MKKCNCEESNNKCCICKLIKVVGIIAMIIGAIVAVVKFINSLLDKKDSEENDDRDVKVYHNFIGTKDIFLDEEELCGVICKNALAATQIDLSDAQLTEDAFISITGHFSAVSIIVPSNIRVCVDGLINKSSVNNYAEDGKEDMPVLYVASKLNFSSLRIARQD